MTVSTSEGYPEL